MGITAIEHEVLTLAEAAAYLRLPEETLSEQAAQGLVPGQRVEGAWRFLKRALDDWLSLRDRRASLLRQAGALADDLALPALRASIYEARGRAEYAADDTDAPS